MTQRLYYTDSFLFAFDAGVDAVRQLGGRTAIVLDRSAFYPTSGGQPFDTGWLDSDGIKLRVLEVAEDEHGEILHFIGAGEDAPATAGQTPALRTPKPGDRVRGFIDVVRRRDHMQQHSGQHVLSAAFVRLFDMATVSFHMGEESCTIDLATKTLTDAQVSEAERLANAVVTEDRPVEIRFATVEQAREMGVRKIPPELKGELRLIDMQDFDLNACGGTHVSRTGQIGAILLRKVEKVKQGVRVEFVCGERAIRTARRDYEVLTEAASLYSSHIWTVSEQIRKSLDEAKAAQKEGKRLLEELAELYAARLVAEASGGVTTRIFEGRDAGFIKLVAQKVVALQAEPAGATSSGAIVCLLGASGVAQPSLVFAQTPGGPFDMGALLKETVNLLGGRGGGNRDMAQGGVPAGADIARLIEAAAAKVRKH